MRQHSDNPGNRARWAGVVAAVALALCLAPAHAIAIEIAVRAADGAAFDQTQVRQTYHQIEVAVHNQVAAAIHSFQLRNDTTARLEITCKYDLTGSELVDGFAYWNGTEKIVGEALPKAQARAVYERITGLRRDPGLLEMTGSSFRFQVFPVEPGETKPVEVRTVAALEQRSGAVEIRVPRANLPAAGAVLSLRVDITDDLPIASVETTGFEGGVTRLGPRHVRVVLEGEVAADATDLAVRYTVATKDHALRLLTHRAGGDDGSFMLLLSPKAQVAQEDILGRDVVFVVDASGSMSGTAIEETRTALAATFAKLSPEDRFDVVVFNDEAQPFFGALRRADPAHVDDALRRIGALAASGGTDIDGALAVALTELDDVNVRRPRALIFLTDGQGSTPPEVTLAKVRESAGGTRVFAFGAGGGVNRPFLSRLARDNRGEVCFIADAATIERDVARLWERIAAPLMVDLELAFEGVVVESLYPRSLPDLYRDGQVIVLGRYHQAGHGTLRLTGTVRGQRRTFTVPIDLPEVEERHAAIEKLWAAGRVGHLTEMIATRRDPELVDEVTRLGVVYNLATDYTAFIAIPDSEKTREVRELLENAREGAIRKLIDTMADIRLSMTHIPPGDPVLSVDAPIDSRRVVAYFPFGLVQDLRWDSARSHWSCRFLVPRSVKPGVYTIRVMVVHRDGASEWKQVQYTIDGTAPEFAADVPARAAAGAALALSVDPFEPVASVTAAIVGSAEEIKLRLDPDSGRYLGTVTLPAGAEGITVIRIVVRDLARNRCQRDFAVQLSGTVAAQ